MSVDPKNVHTDTISSGGILTGTVTGISYPVFEITPHIREVRFNVDGFKPSYIEQLWYARDTGQKEWRPIEVIYK